MADLLTPDWRRLFAAAGREPASVATIWPDETAEQREAIASGALRSLSIRQLEAIVARQVALLEGADALGAELVEMVGGFEKVAEIRAARARAAYLADRERVAANDTDATDATA
ncbi:MAG: hypothetical protein ACK4QW_10000 [Alphaproteobacteria bacterium]